MTEKVAKSGANVIFCEKGIDDMALHFLAKKNIMAVKNISSGDMEKLAKATGGIIQASTKDIPSEGLGEAKLVEEVKIGDDKLVYVRECKNPHAVTVMIRGGSEHVVDEAERSFHDALCVVRNAIEDGKIVAGGGAPEAETAKQLRDYALKVGGQRTTRHRSLRRSTRSHSPHHSWKQRTRPNRHNGRAKIKTRKPRKQMVRRPSQNRQDREHAHGQHNRATKSEKASRQIRHRSRLHAPADR